MRKFFCLIGLGSALALASCAHQRDLSLVRNRMSQLQPLSRYPGTVCEVEARPTQPALARFSQMFPQEVEKLRADAWTFKWRQTESRCQIEPLREAASSPVVKAQLGFVEAAFCLLGQVFFINSPFDELKADSKDVEGDKEWIHIRPKSKPELGLFLDRHDFLLRTRTQSRGEFQAHYRQYGDEWLPDRMEHKPENMEILLDQVEYGGRIGSRRVFKSLMLSVGTERPLAHSQLIVRNCRSL